VDGAPFILERLRAYVDATDKLARFTSVSS
jgi:hypothetical protein